MCQITDTSKQCTLVLKETSTERIIFRALTEQESATIREGIVRYSQLIGRDYNKDRCKELDADLLKVYPFAYPQIIALGDTSLTNDFARKHIDSIDISVPEYVGKSYKCFLFEDWKTKHERIHFGVHVDALSSWNCALERLNYPKFGVIYTELL